MLTSALETLIATWRKEAADESERVNREHYPESGCSPAFIEGQRSYASANCEHANELAAVLRAATPETPAGPEERRPNEHPPSNR